MCPKGAALSEKKPYLAKSAMTRQTTNGAALKPRNTPKMMKIAPAKGVSAKDVNFTLHETGKAFWKELKAKEKKAVKAAVVKQPVVMAKGAAMMAMDSAAVAPAWQRTVKLIPAKGSTPAMAVRTCARCELQMTMLASTLYHACPMCGV